MVQSDTYHDRYNEAVGKGRQIPYVRVRICSSESPYGYGKDDHQTIAAKTFADGCSDAESGPTKSDLRKSRHW